MEILLKIQMSLNAEQMEERLEAFLDPVLSSRRTAAGPARKLAHFDAVQQEFVLRWVEIIARSNAEVAYQFADAVSQAFEAMDEDAIEAWIIHAMDIYDKRGLHAAVAAVSDVIGYVRQLSQKASGVSLEGIGAVLGLFLRGLNGRELKLEPHDEVYTDTETLFLPPLICRFAEASDNFRLYKAMAVHLWAQTWFGSYRPEVIAALQGFDDQERAARLFHAAETVRLDACISRELPGIYRDMRALRERLGEGDPLLLRSHTDHLNSPSATALDSLGLTRVLYHHAPPVPVCYQGRMFPERAEAVIAMRREREKHLFRTAIAKLLTERDGERVPESPESPGGKGRVSVARRPDDELPDGLAFELLLDGQPAAIPEDVQAVMDSIIQDLGEIPPDYLVPAGDGGYGSARSSPSSAPRTCGRAPITRTGRFSTTNGTSSAAITARTGACCASWTCIRRRMTSWRARSRSIAGWSSNCAGPSRRCAARTRC